MKSIFLMAYTKRNFGDDLFIENIMTRYSDVKFYLVGDKKYKKYFINNKNLKLLNEKKSNFDFINKIKQRVSYILQNNSLATVYIGGSIFIEYPTWKNICNWWEYEATKFNFFVLGANFGPYSIDEYCNKMNTIYEKMSDVCFRDKYSYNLFIDNQNVRYAPDILFNTDFPSVNMEKNKIFVSLIDCKSKEEGNNILNIYGNEYENVISEQLKQCIENGYSIVLASFCKDEGDEEAVNRVFNLINDNTNVKKIYYNGENRNDILKEINSSSYVIGTRFHAIVLGLAARKPVFPIIYSKKTLNMMEDINFKGNYIELDQINNLEYDFLMQNLITNYCINIDKIKKESEKHYKKLDELLKMGA